jgi:hypothetical protein
LQESASSLEEWASQTWTRSLSPASRKAPYFSVLRSRTV